MANIISKELSKTHLTPVFSVPAILSSSLRGNVDTSIPKIYIKTDKVLKKEGSSFFIGEDIIDLNHKSIYDFLQILDQFQILNSLVNNEDYCNFPANALLDFSNKESYEINLTSSPYDVKFLKRLKLNTIIQISEECDFNVLKITDNYSTKYTYLLKQDNLFVHNYLSHCKLIYSIQCEEFIIKLGNKFSTNSKEVLGRYLSG